MESNQSTCRICMENYTTPRYLPTCGHTFCEHCLLTYASNIQQQGGKFECPVCRKENCLPEKVVTLDWVQLFPLNTAIIEITGSTKQTKTEVARCDCCKERGEANDGVKFCLDCQETYCQTCADCHKGFKLTKTHSLMDPKQIPAESKCKDFFTSFMICPNHQDRMVAFYCKSHDDVICTTCVLNNHSKPCVVVEVSRMDSESGVDILKEESLKLTSKMRAIVDHLDMLQRLRNEHKKSLKKKLKEIRERTIQMKDQVVKLMDDVVSHVKEVAKQIEIESEDRFDEDISRVSKIKEKTEELLALLGTVEQHGSEKHKFISAYLMKSQIEDIDRQIFKEDTSLKEFDAKLEVGDDIRKLIGSTDIDKLVQVTMNESESGHKHLDGISNYLRNSKLVRNDAYQIRPNSRHAPYYSGITTCRDGKVVLVDNCTTNGCGHLCLYNPANRSIIARLKLGSPFDVTEVDDTHLAVSIPRDKTICIIAVGNELKVEKIFETHSEPWSIMTLRNNQMAVAWTNPAAFSIIDISGAEIIQMSYFDMDKSGRKFTSSEYFAVDERRQHVIQSCVNDKAVYCFDLSGQPVFRYTNPRLTKPRGVALDRCGNIYISEVSQKSIHKLSPAGEPISIFTEGVPSFQRAICSDNTGTGLWETQGEYGHLELRDEIVYFALEQTV